MSRWHGNRLDLGALGEVRVLPGVETEREDFDWELKPPPSVCGSGYRSEAAARRAAEAWARRAVKQASKRLEVGK
jgi:hypothetical protein